jgi:cyclopropane fatty-acyl-phospholipid synthase-like methyltransferase
MRTMSALSLAFGVCFSATMTSQQPQHDQHKPGAPGAHMEHRFDDPARYAKSFDDPARDEWQKPAQVIGALDLKAGQIVADIGAGTGYFSVRLAKAPAAPRVYAVDIEKAMVEYIRQRASKEKLANVTTIQASAASANLPEPVDVVLIVDTYHHIANRPVYFRALQKSLKPGGRVAIIDFRKGAPSGPPEEFRFTPDQISAEMKQAGYVLQTTNDFLPRQLFLVYAASR